MIPNSHFFLSFFTLNFIYSKNHFQRTESSGIRGMAFTYCSKLKIAENAHIKLFQQTVRVFTISKKEKTFYISTVNKNVIYYVYNILTHDMESDIRNKQGYDVYFNSFSSNSRGVAIFFNNDFEFTVHKDIMMTQVISQHQT